jgi:uncharacterized protein (TIGR03435 family)
MKNLRLPPRATNSALDLVAQVASSGLGPLAANFQMRRQLTALVGRAALAALAMAVVFHFSSVSPTFAQSQPELKFDVASVKPNNSGDSRSPSLILPGGRFTATNNSVRSLILNAYSITAESRLQGGPAWIDSARYDIDAKAEDGAIPMDAPNRVNWEKTRLMLRALLADRFKLSMHTDSKEIPVYELVVAKNGPKLQESKADCTASAFACHGFSGNPTRLSGTGVDMYDLALILTNYSDRPVIDATGVQGIFDIKMGWNPRVMAAPATDDAPRSPAAVSKEGARPDLDSLPSIFGAVEQLGLKLESRKGSVQIYTIDHVERASGN